ncbi:MAG TPA: GNAT family N-acetyltransferase [Thermomicrobiales bacterium]|nr:GNAT family N-acetyltransferase [Thermomicrobiales bacterium]
MDGLEALHLTTLDQVSLTALAGALDRGYEGYAIPVKFSSHALAALVRRDHVDLTQSYLVSDDDGVATGAMVIARRGRESRVAGLGIAPAARGQGLGSRMVMRAIEDARGRGDERIRLEVISTNDIARRVYERCGFRITRPLIGYERPGGTQSGTATDVDVEECAPDEIIGPLLTWYPASTSWQTDPASYVGAVPPVQAFRTVEGAMALVDASGSTARLLALAVSPDRRRQGAASRLLQALDARFGNVPWPIPAYVPDTLAAEFFQATGWQRSAMSQFEMEVVF